MVRAERFPRDEKLDMSVDFGALKDIFKSLDHKMMVLEDDELFRNAEIFAPEGVVVIPGKSPTVENVAHYCLKRAAEVLTELFPGRRIEYHLEVNTRE